MNTLNFNDLLALLIEYQIDDIRDYFRRKQSEHDAKHGISRRKATNEDIDNL